MKRKNLIFVMLLVFSGLFTIQSCKKESPAGFTEEQAFTIPVLVAPAPGFVNAPANTVDLTWSSTNASDNPENWKVYFGTGDDPALIKTDYTQQTVTVTVVPGTKYNWKVVGTDAHGITSASPIWSFEVVDPAAVFDVKMSWTTDVKTIVGLDLLPDAAAKLRLLILKEDKLTLAVPAINTGTFPEFDAFNDLADGVYYIATDLASTINAGTFTKTFNISVDLSFVQRGILSQDIPYPDVMTTANPCPSYRTYLAKVTKAGDTYTVDQALSNMVPPIDTWNGTDATYPSEVTSTSTCSTTTITGLGFGWMLDWWGEVIQPGGGTCTYTISGNTITIPLQAYCTTKYNGTLQPAYKIQGTGTIDNSGAYPIWTIQYDFIQSGASIATTAMDYGWPTAYFEAVITTNPAKGVGKMMIQIDKPKR
jgi:hypothetical protein